MNNLPLQLKARGFDTTSVDRLPPISRGDVIDMLPGCVPTWDAFSRMGSSTCPDINYFTSVNHLLKIRALAYAILSGSLADHVAPAGLDMHAAGWVPLHRLMEALISIMSSDEVNGLGFCVESDLTEAVGSPGSPRYFTIVD